jgi:RND family efflux transporter MFP subunit
MSNYLRKIVFVLLFSLSLIACNGEDESDTNSTTNVTAVLISTSQAEVTDLPVWLTTVGMVHSQSTPTLAAEIEGRITMVAVDTGDEIEQGQLLAETDTSTLVLQRQAAQAGIDRLKINISTGVRRVARFETLSAKNMSSQTQLDDAMELLETYRADYKAAAAQLAIVNDSLAKSRIIAPVSGVIQQRMISAGDFVKRGDPLFEITRPNLLQARLPFPETLALQIKIGQPAKIYSPLTPGEFVSGEITELQPSVGLGSRAVLAIINLPDPGKLRPRATLSGKVLVETRQQAVLVPNISVVRRPAGDVVYVINNGTAEARVVETGINEAGLVEILSGVEGNETIATDGAAFLTDGAAVKVAEPVN